MTMFRATLQAAVPSNPRPHQRERVAAQRPGEGCPRPIQASSAHGFVLPVVLVILIVISTLVLMQVRRATVDERLAANTRESIALEGAAKTLLGWCETAVQMEDVSPGDAVLNRPRDIVAPAAGTAAWRTVANWHTVDEDGDLTGGVDFVPQGTALPNWGGGNITYSACLIEDATDELDPPTYRAADREDDRQECRWRKFRITAQVRTAAPGFPAVGVVPAGERGYFVQGETRIYSQICRE